MFLLQANKIVRQHYMVFLIMALASIVLGVILCPDIVRIANGLRQIILHPSLLPTDYLTVGGHIGVGFVHAGLMTLCALFVLRVVKAKLMGLQVAGLMIIFAFSFCGKNLFNIWPLIFGVILEAKTSGKKGEDVVSLAFFACALAPLVSVLSVGTPHLILAPPMVTVPLGIVAGVIAGFLIGKYDSFVRTMHHGTVLYNGAMSAGIVGVLTNFFLIDIGLGHDRLVDNIYIVGQNRLLGWIVFGYALYFLVCGLILNGGFRGIKYLVLETFQGTDFVYQFAMGKTLINMGIVCLIALGYVLLMPKGQLNGPVFGGLFTIVGFAAQGVTPFSMLPAMGGVFMGSFLTGGIRGALVGQSFITAGLYRASIRDSVVAAMFSGGFSPMVKMYGPSAVFAAGMLFSMTVSNIPPLHGWMVNYNNGFSMGLVAVLFLPVIKMYSDRDYVYKIYKGFFGKKQLEEEDLRNDGKEKV